MPKVIAHEEIARRYVEITEMPSKYVPSSAQQKSGQSQPEEEGKGSVRTLSNGVTSRLASSSGAYVTITSMFVFRPPAIAERENHDEALVGKRFPMKFFVSLGREAGFIRRFGAVF